MDSRSPATGWKGYGLNLVTSLNRMPIFKWCVVRRGSKYGHQIDMCLNDIELCAKCLSTILSSMVNIFGRTYLFI